MTPKEKALYLVDDMTFGCKECDYQWIAKKCALIAVDEILKMGWNLPHYDIKDGESYWQEVKQEIEAL